MMELKHLDSWECTLETTAIGTSTRLIRMALGAADIDNEDETKIIPRRDLKISDFDTSLWWVGDKADGGLVAAKIRNALSTSGFSLQTTKDGKGNISLTITGHVSIDDQDTMPMEFYSIDGDDEEETNGTQTEGTQTNGTQTEGTQTEGTQTEGTQTEGTQTEGTQTEGTQTGEGTNP